MLTSRSPAARSVPRMRSSTRSQTSTRNAMESALVEQMEPAGEEPWRAHSAVFPRLDYRATIGPGAPRRQRGPASARASGCGMAADWAGDAPLSLQIAEQLQSNIKI